jgi:hypothetical protein
MPFLIPIMFLTAVKVIDPLHFLLCQREMIQLCVLLDVVGITGTGNDYHVFL